MTKGIKIDVRLLYEFSGEPISKDMPSPQTLKTFVKEKYSFLPQPVGVEINNWSALISYSEVSESAKAEAIRLADRASKRASRGEYDRAIGIWGRALEIDPANHKIRRDLAMAHLEKDEVQKAKHFILDSLKINPEDVWSLVLLGNLCGKNERDLDSAEWFIRRAVALDPDDPWAKNSLGAILMEKRETEEAIEIFLRCIEKKPEFPNPYYGLSIAYAARGQVEDAARILEKLFANAKIQDARSMPVLDEARRTYRSLMAKIAEGKPAEARQAVDEIKQELVKLSGYPIEIKSAETPGQTAAVIQMAWRHGRDHHEILYREDYPEQLLMHLFAHELGHLRLESLAREKGRNRTLVSTTANREKAIRSLGSDIARLKKQGLNEKVLADLTLHLVEGIVRQLFNAPIDMLIESHIHGNFPDLRCVQFLSLENLAKENEKAIFNSGIRKQIPRKIYMASAALNGATAIFVDRLLVNATAYSKPYSNIDSFPVSQNLIELFDDRVKALNPGDEYDIVDAWAEMLGLKGWYEWRDDVKPKRAPGDVEQKKSGNSDVQNNPAAIFYLLGALERFDTMTDSDIRDLSFEVAMLGSKGFDFVSPDHKYSLKAFPGEKFTGLQLVCMMYAGFQRIAPDQDLGIDLSEPYKGALKLHELKKGKDI